MSNMSIQPDRDVSVKKVRQDQSDTIVVLKTILSLFFHLVYEENMKKQKNNRPSASRTRALRFLNP